MSSRRSDARDRVIAAAADMLARHGLNATSIRELARHADAPLGSTYHHFPGGKQQLVGEAVAAAGSQVSAQLERALQAGVVVGLATFLDAWRKILERSAFRAGCPVLAVAVEEPLGEEDSGLTAVARHAFDDWQNQLAGALRAEGVEAGRAAALSTLIVAAVEGAIALCRVERSAAPLQRVAAQLQALVESAVAHAGR